MAFCCNAVSTRSRSVLLATCVAHSMTCISFGGSLAVAMANRLHVDSIHGGELAMNTIIYHLYMGIAYPLLGAGESQIYGERKYSLQYHPSAAHR